MAIARQLPSDVATKTDGDNQSITALDARFTTSGEYRYVAARKRSLRQRLKFATTGDHRPTWPNPYVKPLFPLPVLVPVFFPPRRRCQRKCFLWSTGRSCSTSSRRPWWEPAERATAGIASTRKRATAGASATGISLYDEDGAGGNAAPAGPPRPAAPTSAASGRSPAPGPRRDEAR